MALCLVLVTLAVTASTSFSSTPGNEASLPHVIVSPTLDLSVEAKDGVGCDYVLYDLPHDYQARTHLVIRWGGRVLPIPNEIGFQTNHDCLYWVHTLNREPGIIFIQEPYALVPRLGAFFDIWAGEPWQKSGKAIQAKLGTATVTVNGRRYHGDPRRIPLPDGSRIVIRIGRTRPAVRP
jgi:hypothetical protein